MNSDLQNHSQLSKRSRLIFVNRFYAPDLSATSQILTDIAEALGESDFEVTVFASRLSYDNKALYAKNEQINKVHVRRIWTTSFGRSTKVGRALDYISFYFSITLGLFAFLKKDDVLVAKTDPPMLSIPLSIVAGIRRAKLINWLQDIFPEVLLRLNGVQTDGFFTRGLTLIRNRSLSRSHMNVAIGSCMAKKISGFGLGSNRVTVIENFADDETITPTQDYSPHLRHAWGIDNTSFVIGYSGNLGQAHDLETMIDVATSMNNRRDITFLFVGGGALHNKLKSAILDRSLQNVLVRPYRPREALSESLGLPNLHWASLKPTLEGYIVPSKIYGVAAAGRPLIMIGDRAGEVGQLVSKFEFGRCFNIGASDEVATYIDFLASNREQAIKLGLNARRFILEGRSKHHAVSSWKSMLLER